MSFVTICGILWHPVCTHCSVIQLVPDNSVSAPSECLALWQRQQLNMSVRHASSVVDMLGAKVTTCQHLSCHCWKPCTVPACFHGITHNPYTFTNWCYTHHTQKSKHTSYFKVCHGSGRTSIFNLTYLCYPLTAVQWHNLHVPITCLNLQSCDTISC